MGPVDIEGAVKDAYNDDDISDANVYLIPYKDYNADDLSGSSVVNEKTDTYGNYQYKQVNSGNYYLVIQKDGYKDAIQLLTASSKFNSVYVNEVIMWLKNIYIGNDSDSLGSVNYFVFFGKKWLLFGKN